MPTYEMPEPPITDSAVSKRYSITLELRAQYKHKLRKDLGRIMGETYLTPRKRRRIRRRLERSKLEFEAFEFYGTPPMPGESNRALRQRCRDTWR